ncbi:oligosaccharide flippase family protein [bacterium]|nr:oligosaccharide flippase family protein [bacterium]
MYNQGISQKAKTFILSFMIYGLASAFARFFGFILTPIYTRVLSPEDYGAIELITVSTYFLSIFCATEIWAGVSRDYTESRQNPKLLRELVSTGLYYIILLSAIVIAVVTLFLDHIMDMIILDHKYRSSFYAGVLTIPFSVAFSYFNVLLRFENRPWPFFFGIVSQLVITAAISICLIVVYHTGTWGYFIGQLSGCIAGMAVFLYLLRGYLVPRFSLSILKKILRFSLPIVPAVIAVWLNSYANRFVMLKDMSLHDIGIYAVALKVSSIFMFLEYALRLAWTPFMYELISEPDYLERIKRIYGILLKLLTILFLTIGVFSRELIAILAPAEYQQAGGIAALLCIPAVLIILNLILSAGPLIARKTQYESVCQILGLIFNLTTLLFTVRYWGLVGAALSYVGGTLITSVLYYYYSHKLIKLAIPTAMTLIAAGTMTFAVLMAGQPDITLLSKFVFLILIVIPSSFLLLYKDREVRSVIFRIHEKYLNR